MHSPRKRLTHGLTVLGAYTRSKLLQSNITSLVNTRHYRTVSGSDVPNMFRFAATYAMPWKFGASGFGTSAESGALRPSSPARATYPKPAPAERSI